MIQELAYGSALYELTLRFRDAELRRPLGLALSPIDRQGEDAQRHFAAVVEDGGGPRICAAVVMKPLLPDPQLFDPHRPDRPARAKLRQMAVASAYAGQGLGRRLVRFAEAAVERAGIREVELGARESAVGFYERLGYAVCGDPFIEVGQPHRLMRRRLEQPR